MAAKRRRVSFHDQAIDIDTASSASTSAIPLSPMKSALRRSSQTRTVPAKELYAHADPVIRRLRLVDGQGQAVNLERAFKDVRTIGFLFAADYIIQGRAPFFKDIIEMGRRFPHQFKLVFVSVDTSRHAFLQAIKDQPWLAMEYDDSSNEADDDNGVFEKEETTREQFLMADEADMSPQDLPPDNYTRPWSRVFLAQKWDVWRVPTLVIYDPRSHKVLERDVHPRLIEAGRRLKTWESWSSGRKASFDFSDFLARTWIPLGLSVACAILWLWSQML